ncbi:protein O-linked-mannose beta-1,4-N-acetylglucosaminyltransferase 2-like [Amphiura filiformis]|uniref:protein O-linked-mannose beta-1,4-N-acetylglucosaminyltransferase 2-like n=1 Tax=Amphiura filiformis TaxID=82378 RepID=UPI003B21EA9C
MDGLSKTLVSINIILVILLALFWHRCNEIHLNSDKWLQCHDNNHHGNRCHGDTLLPHDPAVTDTTVLQGGSSVWCKGDNNTDRNCHFHNLCFAPSSNSFLFLHGADTIITGVPDDRYSPALLDLSSVPNHNTQYFHYTDVPVDGLNHFKKVVTYRGVHFVFNRFNPSNLMHVLHDDLLPVFHTLLQLGLFNLETQKSSARLVFLEGWHEGEYFDMYEWMSRERPLLKDALMEHADDVLVCFEDVFLGLSKQTTWYQYGFDRPQGPLANSKVTATEIRVFTNAFLESLNMSNGNQEDHQLRGQAQIPKGQSKVKGQNQACLFTRESNRLILNEADVISTIAQHFDTELSSNLYKNSLSMLLQNIQKCKLVVGMHGSLLALIMFLLPGSAVIELYPYAVNPDHYTPYKTLANLPGMQITYKAWRNNIPENTVTHPYASPEKGGILHLSLQEQQRIMGSNEVPQHLCCSDPEWLYRIYQDTIVDIPSFHATLLSAIEIQNNFDNIQSGSFKIKAIPGAVQNSQCKRTIINDVFGIKLSWQPPWNLQFFTNIDQKYEVWIQVIGHGDYKAWILEMTEYVFTEGLDGKSNYRVWVRCLVGDKVGPFTSVHPC